MVTFVLRTKRIGRFNITLQNMACVCPCCLPWSLVPGPWTLVPGPWSLDPGPWSLDPGPWSLVPGPWSLVPGPWSLVPGPWLCMSWSMGNTEVVNRNRVLLSSLCSYVILTLSVDSSGALSLFSEELKITAGSDNSSLVQCVSSCVQSVVHLSTHVLVYCHCRQRFYKAV